MGGPRESDIACSKRPPRTVPVRERARRWSNRTGARPGTVLTEAGHDAVRLRSRYGGAPGSLNPASAPPLCLRPGARRQRINPGAGGGYSSPARVSARSR
ncbi:hypothetical protein GCM10017776_22270 [Streptomyces griseoluteus]|nr:hypothetical protein GCM10017776_22270 [Streptomyces griseoluteus]